jgi:RNA ligase
MLPFTMPELSEAVRDGRVTARRHPFLPYTIYNYSPAVQYSNRWDEITLTCRGLILDDEANVVARPWRKFFNLGQVELPLQFTDPVEVMDKADGSLGILYPTDTGYAIATRGSMVSEQAIHATNLFNTKYAHLLDYETGLGSEFTFDYTFLFEIVYPKNRIVLNYDGMDDLILLGAVQKSTGHYVSPLMAATMLIWDGPVVKVFDFNTISDALGHMDRDNAEGYVIRSGNFMVKLKQPDYLELHRLVTNITPKTVWEQLRVGKSVDEIVSVLPDEFHSMAKNFAEPLLVAYSRRSNEILEAYFKTRRLAGDMTRGEYARSIRNYDDKRYFFLMLDDRPIRDVLWTELKPKESPLTLETAGD